MTRRHIFFAFWNDLSTETMSLKSQLLVKDDKLAVWLLASTKPIVSALEDTSTETRNFDPHRFQSDLIKKRRK